MRRERGDHVIVAVAIDVGDEHLRAAVLLAEGERVLLPHGIAGERLRLAPPAVLEQHVRAPVAVDVADAETVREALEAEVLAQRMERPRSLGRTALGPGPAELPF